MSLICKRQTFRLKTFNWPTIAADSSNGKRNEKGDRREIPSDVESHQVLAYFSFFSFLIGRCFNALVLFLFLIDFCKRLAAVRQSITAYRQNQFSATKNKKESRPTTRKKNKKKRLFYYNCCCVAAQKDTSTVNRWMWYKIEPSNQNKKRNQTTIYLLYF